jgi:hypothetical protein
MLYPPRSTAVLTRHPQVVSKAVHRIHVRVSRAQTGVLALVYRVDADSAGLRIPPPAPPRRSDRLWEHTCFEAFIAQKGKPEYYEFNFCPSGEWAAYSFRSYRDGMRLHNETPPPRLAVRTKRDSLELRAVIDLRRLRILTSNERLRLGFSTVIEENNGILSYWALKHPPGKPDFHHSDCFALELNQDILALGKHGRLRLQLVEGASESR